MRLLIKFAFCFTLCLIIDAVKAGRPKSTTQVLHFDFSSQQEVTEDEIIENINELKAERTKWREIFLKEGLKEEVDRDFFKDVYYKITCCEEQLHRFQDALVITTQWGEQLVNDRDWLAIHDKLGHLNFVLVDSRDAYFIEAKNPERSMPKVEELYRTVVDLQQQMDEQEKQLEKVEQYTKNKLVVKGVKLN